jgi:hypothetical protein
VVTRRQLGTNLQPAQAHHLADLEDTQHTHHAQQPKVMQYISAHEGHHCLRGEARQEVHQEPATQVNSGYLPAIGDPCAILTALRARVQARRRRRLVSCTRHVSFSFDE